MEREGGQRDTVGEQEGGRRREKREHSAIQVQCMIIMRLIIKLIAILVGLIIILIRLNKIVFIIIKAVGFDRDHQAVDGSTVLDPDSSASEVE